MVRFIGSRKDLTEDKLDDLEEIVMDSTKCQAIFEAARMSMGKYQFFLKLKLLRPIALGNLGWKMS